MAETEPKRGTVTSARKPPPPFTDEHRANLSKAHLGRSLSAEHRAKLSEARRGYKHSAERLARQSESHKRGANVGYGAAHYRAGHVLPKTCEWADETCKGTLEAAFRHEDAPPEFVKHNTDGSSYYVGPDPRDGYIRLCRSHHFRYDHHHVRPAVTK